MKILKNLLIALAIIVAIPLVSGLVMNRELNIERSIVIDRPNAKVFDFVKYLKNQEKYSKWAAMDPEMKKEYKGADGTPGFISIWESQNKKAGAGEQEIKKITDGKRIDYELRFKKPYKSTSSAWMTTEAAGDKQTLVKWGYAETAKYPWNVMNPWMKSMLSKDLDTGLENLKKIMEEKK